MHRCPPHARFHLKTLDDLRAELDRLGLSLPISDDVSILGNKVKIGGHETPNRFVVQPMEGFDADDEGRPGDLAFRRYRRYAEGGSGLIWFEATAVLSEARSNPGQFWLHEGSVDAFAGLVEATRRAAREKLGREPVLVLQLTHSGRYSRPTGAPEPIIAHRSPVLDPKHDLPEDYPLVTDDYLDRLQDTFVEAAKLAARAGFDEDDALRAAAREIALACAFRDRCAEAGQLASGSAGARLKAGKPWRDERDELQLRMSRAGAHIRSLEGLKEAVAEARAQWGRIGEEGCGFADTAGLKEAFTTRQLCFAHLVYLEAALHAVASGVGSRGSAIVLSPEGQRVHEKLGDEWRFQPEDPAFRGKVLETVTEGDSVKNAWVARRPIPEPARWFETAWAAFREGEIYG